MKSPITWIGGKALLANWIVSNFPERWEVFIEAFCGGAHMYFRIGPCPAVLNDINFEICNFFRVARAPEKREKLLEKLAFTPYSRELFAELCETAYSGDEIERAWQFFVLSNMCFSGSGGASRGKSDFSSSVISNKIGHWTPSPGSIKLGSCVARGMSKQTSKFRTAIRRLSKSADLLQTAIIENLDFRKLLNYQGYRKPGCFVYADPPYIRNGKILDRYYGFKWSMEDFEDLAELLNGWPGPVMFSNYPDPVFDDLFPADKWRREFKKVAVSACRGDIKPRRIEMIVMNYEARQKELNLCLTH